MRKPTVFQIQEAILANICAPSPDEMQEFTIARFVRASSKYEGDSQLGIMLFIGIANHFGYSFSDIASIATVEREEFNFKLSKFKRKSRSNDHRFLNKLKLIMNFLRLRYDL